MKIVRTLQLIILSAILGGLAAGAAWFFITRDSDSVNIHDATLKEVRSMVRLCSMEIYEDVPVKASIGSRHIFARVTLTGSISFDLEKIGIENKGDTLYVELPPETVEILESTGKDSYIVIDTWNDKIMGSSRFTAAEENKIKEKIRQNAVKNIYRKGYVKRARAEAVTNLTAMLSAFTGKTVIVTDPTPDGKRQPA